MGKGFGKPKKITKSQRKIIEDRFIEALKNMPSAFRCNLAAAIWADDTEYLLPIYFRQLLEEAKLDTYEYADAIYRTKKTS